MIYPPTLKQGDTIALVSTARKITQAELKTAIEIIESRGFKVKLGTTIGASDNQYAGTEEERLADFQAQLDDYRVKAIFCAKGGYGTVRIIDDIDFRKFVKNPKWICGFSDVTVLHNHINHVYGIGTLHCPNASGLAEATEESLNSIFNVLEGKNLSYNIPSTDMNRTGKGEGILVGGNLSLIYSLSGTDSEINCDDKILFIEDLDEYYYHIDRMMQQLKRSGKLSNLVGLIVGSFTDIKDNPVPFGKSIEEIILEAVADYDFPVIFNFPAGHQKDNRALVMGTTYKFYPENDNVIIKQLR
jgi:muramoyltetrapeptide carboxypeptidase